MRRAGVKSRQGLTQPLVETLRRPAGEVTVERPEAEETREDERP